MNFATIDYVIFVVYGVVIIAIGLWVSRTKKGEEKTAEDYFLASKSLPWWAIGASLIAANISAEQFIGMSGSGFAMGLSIASYEWMAALTLLIVGKFFLPIFIKQGLYTIPEFVEKRFGKTLKTILAVFWIALFVFVNLTSVMFLGAKALDTIMGSGDGSMMLPAIIGLALFAASYSLYGGLSAVAWTDVIQVVLLIIGGLVTSFLALQAVTPDGGIFDGLSYIYDKVPERFSMILSQGEITTPNGKDAWNDLPGLSVLIGGMWVANLYYWGFNQYIIQRTFAAKSLKESQKGIVFAAILKIFVPVIVVVPGIIAYVMFQESPEVAADFTNPDGSIANDSAYPWLISNYVPAGIKGLVMAALAAAIISSLASMLNSTSTIFTMDIYKPLINKKASDKSLVTVGRLTGLVALVIAIFMAPLLGGIPQAFQYIQEYTGIVSPGILSIFILGLFWKKTTTRSAIVGAFVSIFIAMYLKVGAKGWSDLAIFPDLPWMHQMGITFLATVALMVGISLFQGKGEDDPKGIPLSRSFFKTSPLFNVLSFAVILMLVVIYAIFW